MDHVDEVRVAVRPLEHVAKLVGHEAFAEVRRLGAAMRRRMARRVFWNVNSTAAGGGVAEMLHPLVGYARSVGVDARWVAIRGNPAFFRVTKRLHHALHGSCGDGSPLDDAARSLYETTLRASAAELRQLLRRDDIVLLHDPQTLGMATELARAGALVVWRCHVGHDTPGEEVDRAWRFLLPYLSEVSAFVFSRSAYVPAFCEHGKAVVIQPSIDPFAPKNQPLSPGTVRSILGHTGLVAASLPETPALTFTREDGSPGRAERRAEVVRAGSPPGWRTPLVVQVSRWDPLKDPIGVLQGFADGVNGTGAHLVLAGPDVKAVADDPEGRTTFEAVVAAWERLAGRQRSRIHLAMLPMDDVEENAVIVNALQRHAAVVVQKSLHEGFGLTVTEAMWKARPVVASAVGGIQDQIEDGVHGLLLRDPEDLEAFGGALRRLLGDPAYARSLGRAARSRVRHHFLGVRHLLEYAALVESLDRSRAPSPHSTAAGSRED